MSNTYQKDLRRAQPDRQPGEIAVPEQVIVPVAEIAESAKEGLLALAVGTGLQVMAAMFAENAERLCGQAQPRPRGIPARRRGRVGHAGLAQDAAMPCSPLSVESLARFVDVSVIWPTPALWSGLGVTSWLIDKSAFVRLTASPDAAEWATRIERGLVRITTVTRLEVGLGGEPRRV